MNELLKTLRGLQFVLMLAIAFLLPFGWMVGILAGILFGVWVLDWSWKEKFERIRAHILFIPFLLFYGLHALGLLWTANAQEGVFSMQVKSALFILPLVIASYRYDTRQTQRVLGVFLAGLVACGLFMLGRATMDYVNSGINTFFYQELTRGLIHPSYLSMYFCAGIMLLFHGVLLQAFSVRWKIIAISLSVFFALVIFLLSSKMGILTMIFLFTGYIAYMIFRFKRYVAGIGAMVVLVAVFMIAMKVFPELAGRVDRLKQTLMTDQPVDPSETESNKVRLIIWQADYAVMSRHLLLGVGTGDVRDTLLAEYAARGMTGAYDKKLNAHSQLFQTGIALGLVGLISLLLLIVAPAVWAIRKQYGFAVLLSGLILINIIPESMFEMQAGTLFVGFFFSFVLFAAERGVVTLGKGGGGVSRGAEGEIY